jgi:hypothetical protein
VLDRYGLARTLSLPPDRDEFVSEYASSYRVRNGVLHNPKADRRTTAGIFHIAEGGLPIPDDKVAVPKAVFGAMLQRALQPPRELLRLPFTSTQEKQAECFVSLLLRPVVARRAGIHGREDDGGSLLRAQRFGEQSGFCEASSATPAIHSCRRTMQRWTWNTGRVIPAA